MRVLLLADVSLNLSAAKPDGAFTAALKQFEGDLRAASIVFLCGKFDVRPVVGARLEALVGVLARAVFGPNRLQCEIAKYVANFCVGDVGVQTALFAFAEAKRDLLATLHAARLLNYCPLLEVGLRVAFLLRRGAVVLLVATASAAAALEAGFGGRASKALASWSARHAFQLEKTRRALILLGNFGFPSLSYIERGDFDCVAIERVEFPDTHVWRLMREDFLARQRDGRWLHVFLYCVQGQVVLSEDVWLEVSDAGVDLVSLRLSEGVAQWAIPPRVGDSARERTAARFPAVGELLARETRDGVAEGVAEMFGERERRRKIAKSGVAEERARNARSIFSLVENGRHAQALEKLSAAIGENISFAKKA